MLGGIAVGETVIHGLLVGDDVLRTARAMQAMGAQVVPPSPESGAGGVWRVTGRGVGALTEPEDVLDLGNAVHQHALADGPDRDQPHHRRPDRRREPAPAADDARDRALVAPWARDSSRAPAGDCRSPSSAPPMRCRSKYRLPVASAQVKSAILLAGLNTPGATTVIEPVADAATTAS